MHTNSFVHDTRIVFLRAMTLALQNPLWIVVSIIQPVIYLVLFGPLLENIAGTSGFPQGEPWQIFVPGLLVQLGIFGTFFSGFAVIAEWRDGVIERMMVSPASRTALIAGRVLRQVVLIVVQGMILLGLAYFFGLRVSLGAIVIGLVFLGILGGAFASFSYAAGLAFKSEDALAPFINVLALPILLLSGILLPMSLAPGWLQFIASINPIKHVVDAVRLVFLNQYLNQTTMIGFIISVIILAIALFLGNRVFQAESK